MVNGAPQLPLCLSRYLLQRSKWSDASLGRSYSPLMTDQHLSKYALTGLCPHLLILRGRITNVGVMQSVRPICSLRILQLYRLQSSVQPIVEDLRYLHLVNDLNQELVLNLPRVRSSNATTHPYEIYLMFEEPLLRWRMFDHVCDGSSSEHIAALSFLSE